MKISANELRIGMLIEHNGKLWTVCKLQHVKPGKGGAYMQTEMKEVRTGTKLNERFRSDESLEKVRLDEEECQLLFKEGDLFTFMNMATFDQLQISKDIIGEAACFLQDNMIVKISAYEGEIIGVVLPDVVVMEVVEADAVVKGQTATASYKPAILENGVRILVPPHIESGTKIVVNTSDASYVERAK
jgi:elongation factor P